MNNDFQYVQVLVDIPNIDTRTFSYKVSEDLKPKLKIGQIVLVPFGMQGAVNAFVVGFSNYLPANIKAKSIYQILEETPVFTLEYLNFLQWISAYYCCSLQSVIDTAVPASFISKSKKIVTLLEDGILGGHDFSKEQLKILEILKEKQKTPQTSLLKAAKLTPSKFYEALRKLKAAEILTVQSEIEEKSAQTKFEKTIVYKNSDNATKRQQTVLDILKETGDIKQSDFIKLAKTTGATLKKLEQNGNLEIKEAEVYRNALKIFANVEQEDLAVLNAQQNFAYYKLKEAFKAGDTFPFLLYGITGSGKTEIYFKLINDVIEQGKTVIFLVPEIALASQLARRFAAKFGIEQVAVWHSSVSEGEKYDIYQKLKSEEIKIIIGARSAVFAPIKNIGLIVIDEEHESTYKQTSVNPRYDARLLAKERAQREGAMVLLGTATPDINSYYEALNSNHLLTLTERYNDAKLPKVKVVDMRFENAKGNHSIFSNALRNEINANLANKKQIILLVNRRGFSTTSYCVSCGHIIECPKCSIPLILHKPTNQLRCHYCNYTRNIASVCPECGEETIKNYGLGTQKVEEFARQDFPEAQIARLDSDIMSTKHGHINILQDFANGKIDILIGTQMIAKGLDNHNVTLVGVLMADQSFRLPDFRASERGFQLLTQVAGRAGRGNFEGLVIFQSYNPDFFALTDAKNQDYKNFYLQEIQNRYELGYPPYSKLIRFIVSSKLQFRAEKLAAEIANRFLALVKNQGIEEKLEIFGPSECVLSKLNNEYRYQILIKNRMGGKGHFLITSFIKTINTPSEIKFLIDVDPVDML
ncbi:MAG: primosomal protein N' [Candidatus Gastranaerophilales bacterium]|nr:primosomal protein N' [Candidatus Gastranaerophilales bacterium]